MIVFLFISQAILLFGQCTRLGTWKGMPLKGRRKSDPLGYDESTVDRLIPGTGTLCPVILSIIIAHSPGEAPCAAGSGRQ